MIKSLDTAPILANFHRMTPMEHQDTYFRLSREMPYYGLFWEMGTAKSKVITDTISWLFLNGEIDGAIIISDNGCYLNWPEKEIPKQMPLNLPYRTAIWTSAPRRHEQEQLKQIMVAKDDTLDILCMNVESFSGGKAYAAAAEFIANHYVLMCVDESTSIKNIKSARTKNILDLGKRCDYRRILTGTPITQSPLDVYAQCEFLCPGVLGFKSFLMFKSYYAIVKQVPSGRWHYDIILGYNHLDELTKSLQPFTSRLLKTECLDLPGKVYETIYVEQTPEQQRYYNSLKETAIIQLDQGLLTSTTAITTINKLHQINCGHVKLDDHTEVDIPSNRVRVLLETLDKILPNKVVVWCRFQRDVTLIMEAIKKEYEKQSFYGVHYYGETSDHDRKTHLTRFQSDDNCKWFVGTASTGGKGIDGLQDVCSYEVYYSSSYDREDRAQSEDRLDRKGQKNKVTVVDLIIPRTVDEAIWKALKQKEDLAYQVLDRFREML